MKMKLLATYTLSLTFILLPLVANAFTWGVCGHQIWGGAVWRDTEAQFATMEQHGLTTYRFDVPLVNDKPHAADDVERLIGVVRKHHIILHPILYVPFTFGDNATDGGKYPATEAGLEAQGYNRVYPFVLRFASQLHEWELENELNMKKGVKSGIGNSASDYETPKAHQWAAVLRGMSKAIRDVHEKTGQPMKIIVDIGYVDFGLIPFLEHNGIFIDKLAYHYYYGVDTSPYKIYPPKGYIPPGTVDIFAEFKKMGKPVIINEFNAAEIYTPKFAHKPYDDAKALASLKKHLDYITGQKEANIEGIEYYELYNEPKLDVAESNFGLMKDATHTKTQMLLASVYACGKLSEDERKTLVTSGLFTEAALQERLKSCRQLSILR